MFFSRWKIYAALVVRDWRLRYVGSRLGGAWFFWQPLFYFLLYTFVFSTILKVKLHTLLGPEDFSLYLLSGLVPWFYFQDAVLRAAVILHEQAYLFKKTPLPLSSTLLFCLAGPGPSFLFSLLFLGGLALFKGCPPAVLLNFPLGLAVSVLFTLSFCLWLIPLGGIFRDLGPFMQILVNVFFFLSPVFYAPEMIPRPWGAPLKYSPFYAFLTFWRASLTGVLPGTKLGLVLLWCLLIGGPGSLFFRKTLGKLGDYL